MKSYFSKEDFKKNILILQFIHPCFLAEIQFLSNSYENCSVMRIAKFRVFYSKPHLSKSLCFLIKKYKYCQEI